MHPNAMADCVFPEDIMMCILTRIPVISIIRFKSVCKPWLHLFSTPEFVKMHHGQFSINPKNQHFIIHRVNMDYSNIISLLNAESNQKKNHMTLGNPFGFTHSSIGIVGCCNGLFCIRRGQQIVLWNPAMNLSKEISPSVFGVGKGASIGFGYDAVGSDFKVVRIVLEERRQGEVSVSVIGVEVYSVVSDSWTTIDVGFQFSVFGKVKNDVIVNGNPYWRAEMDGNKFLVVFDVKELVFKVLPLSELYHEKEAEFMFDCNGRLGALVCNLGERLVECLDVWVFDDGERIWRKDRTYGPIDVYVDRVLQCLKNGKVLGARPNGKVCVFSPETGRIKSFQYAVQPGQPCEAFGYTESLAYVRGMEKVKLGSWRYFGKIWL